MCNPSELISPLLHIVHACTCIGSSTFPPTVTAFLPVGVEKLTSDKNLLHLLHTTKETSQVGGLHALQPSVLHHDIMETCSQEK